MPRRAAPTGQQRQHRSVGRRSKAEGLPDGLTVDADGFLWLAVWGRSQVRRYDPLRRPVATTFLPTPNVSSCTFRWPELSALFLTTAAMDIPPEDAGRRQAGSAFVIPTVGQGRTRQVFPAPSQ
ncbi:SMP-30/gluconolactonase/LRE family protein [Kribbella aluminosa]|uniref:SMP-30/gluconolactonase/LRE family protein n=1 Tax=Kribbella aluminosa TaxID=416017 RepID=UPI003CD07524